MNIAYFATPDFAAHFLEQMLTDSTLPVQVKLVVTQPDKPVGRKKILTSSPVKSIAQKYQIRLFDKNPHSSELIHLMESEHIDLTLLFAYGEFIKKDLLKAPKYGFWNIHPSLLPRYRGASPIAYPLMLGEGESGVTLMQMDEELDHGPIIAQKRVEVSPIAFRQSVEETLSHISYKIFFEKISEFVQKKGSIDGIKMQDHRQATFTRQLSKDDGYVSYEIIKIALQKAPIITAKFPIGVAIIDEYVGKYMDPLPWQKKPVGEIIFNLFRGLSPWPGLWTMVSINGQPKRLKLTSLSYDHETSTLSLEAVQLEGKNAVDFKTFQSAYHIF